MVVSIDTKEKLRLLDCKVGELLGYSQIHSDFGGVESLVAVPPKEHGYSFLPNFSSLASDAILILDTLQNLNIKLELKSLPDCSYSCSLTSTTKTVTKEGKSFALALCEAFIEL
jgi:hypothetical protein